MQPSTYVVQLQLLKKDLQILMGDWPPGAAYDAARARAEAIAPLIEGQIQVLQDAAFQFHEADEISLRNELESLLSLLTDPNERERFSHYAALLDAHINED